MKPVLEPKPVVVRFSRDHPTTGYVWLNFSEVICIRKGGYPVVFEAEQPRRFDLRAPGFAWGDSALLRSLVATLIGDGSTGVTKLIVYDGKNIGIRYDPRVLPPHLFRMKVRDVLRNEDRHDWAVTVGRLGRIVRRSH